MTILEITAAHNISLTDISRRYGIPYRSLQHWSKGDREAPEYVLMLLNKAIQFDQEQHETEGEQ